MELSLRSEPFVSRSHVLSIVQYHRIKACVTSPFMFLSPFCILIMMFQVSGQTCWMLLKKKKMVGRDGLLGIRELHGTMWKSCIAPLLLGFDWFFKGFMIFQRIICPYIKLLTQSKSNHTEVAGHIFSFYHHVVNRTLKLGNWTSYVLPRCSHVAWVLLYGIYTPLLTGSSGNKQHM